MMETRNPYTKKNYLLLFSVFCFLFLLPVITEAQSNENRHLKITPTAIKNYRIGLNSGNQGIMQSCVYFAGKYRMHEVCSDLLEVIENSDDVELCKLSLWSLYQIGNDKYCDKLQKIVTKHKSGELFEFYNFLNKIRLYGNNLAANN